MSEQYTIDAELYKSAMRQMFWKRLHQSFSRFAPSAIVLGSLFFLPWIIDPHYSGNYTWLPLFILAFVLLVVADQWVLYSKGEWITARVIARDFMEPRRYQISFTSTDITIHGPEREWRYPWEEFRGALMCKGFLLLPHPKDGAWPLPKKQLSGKFLEELESHIKEKTGLLAQWDSIGNTWRKTCFVLAVFIKVLLSITAAGLLVATIASLMSLL